MITYGPTPDLLRSSSGPTHVRVQRQLLQTIEYHSFIDPSDEQRQPVRITYRATFLPWLIAGVAFAIVIWLLALGLIYAGVSPQIIPAWCTIAIASIATTYPIVLILAMGTQAELLSAEHDQNARVITRMSVLGVQIAEHARPVSSVVSVPVRTKELVLGLRNGPSSGGFAVLVLTKASSHPIAFASKRQEADIIGRRASRLCNCEYNELDQPELHNRFTFSPLIASLRSIVFVVRRPPDTTAD